MASFCTRLHFVPLKRFNSAFAPTVFGFPLHRARLTLRTISSTSPSRPRQFPTSGFAVIDHSESIEEETLPLYYPEKYYPVRIGEVFDQRYQVVGKLGYGTTSTVWLAHDALKSQYVALKVFVSGKHRTNELKVYDHLNSIKSPDHPGIDFIRKLFGSFQIDGPHGKHLCLVHEALGLSLKHFMQYLINGRYTLELLKPSLRQMLMAVDFLHSQAALVHTDLQITNFLIGVEDQMLFSRVEDAEFTNPTPRKIFEDRVIYMTRRLRPTNTLPFLCDFGEVRFADEVGPPADIMPDLYKAPEVMLHMHWDYKVDIWNMAMVIWHLVTGRTLIQGVSPDGTFHDDRAHIAYMIALMGPPPLEFLKKSNLTPLMWNEDGSWKLNDEIPIPDITLEKLAVDITGEDKDGFLRFFRRMLRWIPEERPTCEELIFDPWLMKGLGLR